MTARPAPGLPGLYDRDGVLGFYDITVDDFRPITRRELAVSMIAHRAYARVRETVCMNGQLTRRESDAIQADLQAQIRALPPDGEARPIL